jgi:hypothetical protein
MPARIAFSILVIVSLTTGAQSQAVTCTVAAHGQLNFPDALVMQTGLAVNPDGAAASYAPGDHGYTYISNGVNLIADGKKISCSKKANNQLCTDRWKEAELGKFGPGTPEFCSFAIAVIALPGSPPPQTCEGKSYRFILGNGKGQPAPGYQVTNIEGQTVTTYLSTTTLMHRVGGEARYVDSSSLPGLVVPEARPDLVGSIAWVRMGSRSTFAIVNDTGPAFGEATVALHEVLQYDTPPPPQPIGPIPLARRCSEVETLRIPFVSRPDHGDKDLCRAARKPTSPSDIRAYGDIPGGVQSVILKSVKPPMRGNLATIELTPTSIRETAISAGYDEKRLAAMADCLNRSAPKR